LRIGVYGGSFNPPHVGHALVCGWLRWTGRVDEVWLVPAYEHAFSKLLAPFSFRVDLCRALAADLGSGLRVEAIEATLPTPSYTLRTLRVLAATHPGVQLQLVVGADVLEQKEHWHRWDRIQQDFTPIVVGRAGHDPVAESPSFPEISSTQIRRRLAAGQPVDHLVTASVASLLRASPRDWTP